MDFTRSSPSVIGLSFSPGRNPTGRSARRQTESGLLQATFFKFYFVPIFQDKDLLHTFLCKFFLYLNFLLSFIEKNGKNSLYTHIYLLDNDHKI